MVDNKTQDDGLPSLAALNAFDKSLAEIKASKDRLMGSTQWIDFEGNPSPGESKISDAYWSLAGAIDLLATVRARFRTETVTTTKVVRA